MYDYLKLSLFEVYVEQHQNQQQLLNHAINIQTLEIKSTVNEILTLTFLGI